MSNQKTTPQSILLHIAEEDIPSTDIDLWSSLRDNLVKSKQFVQQGDSHLSTRVAERKRYRLAIGASLLMVFFVVFLIFTPQGMAFARQVFGYFIPAPQTTYPMPPQALTAQAMPEELQPTSGPTETPASAQDCPQTASEEMDLRTRYLCDVTYIQKEMGTWVKVLPFNYGSLEYRRFNIYYLPSTTRAILRVEYGPAPFGAIAILQGIGKFPPTLSEDGSDDHYSEVPPEAIELVTVNGQPGEYVAGGFVQMPGSDLYTWTNEMPMVRLRWMVGDTWFEIARPGTPEEFREVLGSKESIIRLAEALIPVTEVSQEQP